MGLTDIIVETELTIDPKDIDEYKHLNNAAYSDYFETARRVLESAVGIDSEKLSKQGFGFVVTDAVYSYRKQLKAHDNVVIKSRFKESKQGPLRFYIVHEMYLGKDLVASANTAHAFIELETQKPSRSTTREFRQKYGI